MAKKVFLCFIFSFAVFAAAQNEATRAYELMNKGQYKESLALLEEAIATQPDWYFPIFLKARNLYKLGEYDKALQNYNDALTLEVDSKYILIIKFDMARIYMEKQDYPRAIRAFTELTQQIKDGRAFDLFLNRGQCEMAIAKESSDKDTRKANEYFSKAIVSFTEALKIPTNKEKLKIEASFQRAYAQYQIGNFDGTLKSLQTSLKGFQDVLKQDPKHEVSHRFLIDVGFRLCEQAKSDAQKAERYAEVVTFIDGYLSNWPNSPEMVYRKGLALQGEKKYKDAVAVFKQAISMNPKEAKYYFSLGSCEMAARKFNDAIDSLQKAIQKGEKGNQNIYLFLANCYQQQKTDCYHSDIPLYEKAVAVLEQGLKAIPSNPSLKRDLDAKLNNLGILKDNQTTDEENRKNTLDNIGSLVASIEKNEKTLMTNKERHIQQPTEELQRAIDEGTTTLKADNAKLDQELKTLQKYVREADKCGGSKASNLYGQMKQVLVNHNSTN